MNDEFEKYGYQLQAPIKGFACACGEPLSPNTVHRKNNPCYVKELTLTDEEILKLADETCLTAWIAINPIMDIEKQKEIAKQKMIDFAKAILRKAQEK